MPLVRVLHGPNLNLLGTREPELYGATTLAALDASLVAAGGALGLTVETFQSNDEGVLVTEIQKCLHRADTSARRPHADALIINPAGYTHTSVALRDAVLAVRHAVPVIEVHLTVPSGREPFRRQNFLSDVVTGRIEGFGPESYRLALQAASALIASRGDD